MDRDGNAEIVIASSDSGGTVRFVEAPNLTTDLATRYGFGAVYGVDYRLFGVAQAEGNGKASIVVASSDSGGAVRVMEVDAGTLATTLADSAARFGFGKIALMGLVNPYYTDVDLTAVISTDNGTVAAHIMDENLTDLTVFQIP
jgi:hypothetical protein